MYMYVWVSNTDWARYVVADVVAMSEIVRPVKCARGSARYAYTLQGPLRTAVGVHLVVRAAMGARAGLCCSLPENVGDEQWVKRTTPCKKTEVIS